MGQTLTDAQKAVSNPIQAAVGTAQSALSPGKAAEESEADEETEEDTGSASAAKAAVEAEIKDAQNESSGDETPAEVLAVEAGIDAIDGAEEEAPREQADE
jgi:hypothetical protein